MSDRLDSVDRRVLSIVYTEVARAYGFRQSPEPNACEECDGDGCDRCGFTGEAA